MNPKVNKGQTDHVVLQVRRNTLNIPKSFMFQFMYIHSYS